MSTVVMDSHGPRRMTRDEYVQGFIVCPCGKFAHVVRPDVLRRLPREYSGELCPECSMWMCSVEITEKAGGGAMSPASAGSSVFLLTFSGGVCWAGIAENVWPKGRKMFGRQYEAQGGRCAICGLDFAPDKLTRDHIVPRAKGGGTQWDNIQLVCEPCNARKADTLPQTGVH